MIEGAPWWRGMHGKSISENALRAKLKQHKASVSGVYLLTRHDHFETSIVGLFTTKRGACRKAIELRHEEWVRAFDASRWFGRRERFMDEGVRFYGTWWDESPRNYAPLFRVACWEPQA